MHGFELELLLELELLDELLLELLLDDDELELLELLLLLEELLDELLLLELLLDDDELELLDDDTQSVASQETAVSDTEICASGPGQVASSVPSSFIFPANSNDPPPQSALPLKTSIPPG